MTKRKPDNKNSPPDNSPPAKDGQAQNNLGPEDSQVLQEFPWLKKLKTNTEEVANPTEAPAQVPQIKEENPQESMVDTEQGPSKKKKRGAQKKGQSGNKDEVESAPTQKSKGRKQNKKGKADAEPEIEPVRTETNTEPNSTIESNEQPNENETNVGPEMETSRPQEITPTALPAGDQSNTPEVPKERLVANTALEVDISSLAERTESDQMNQTSEPEVIIENPPKGQELPREHRVVKTTLMENYISGLLDETSSDSPDKNIAPAAVPESAPPSTNRVAKTMLEMDISKFADSPQTPAPEVTPEVQPPVHSEPAIEQKRTVAKTLLENDISKFMDVQSNPPDNVAPEAVPESAPPANRVAKTMLEMDITKFADKSPTPAPDATPHSQLPPETPPPMQPTRTVAKTLMETDISKFTNPDHPIANQPTENKAGTENRVVPKTLLETDISKFTESIQPEVAEQQQIAPAQQPQAPRTVAKTLLETDISQFRETPQPGEQYSHSYETRTEPMASQAPQGLSKADSPSFADVEIPQQVNLVQGQDNRVPQQTESNVQSGPNSYQYYEQPNDAAYSEDREAPKTLLDMELIHTTLGQSIVRLEAAQEEQLRASQALRKFEPIDDFKLTSPNCPWRWDDPQTKERIAFCEQCGAQAYNFTGLQLPDALKLIFQRENIEKPQLYKREDGKFMTRDCPTARKKAATPFFIAGICCLVIFVIALLINLMPKPAPSVVEQSSTQSDTSSTSSTTQNADSSSQQSPNTQQSQTPSSFSSGTQSTSSTSPQQTSVIHTKIYKTNPYRGNNPSSGVTISTPPR